MTTWYVIPARRGSKGCPGKNRKLFPFTYEQIPAAFREKTIVTTDDEDVLRQAKEMNCLARSRALSGDSVSIKPVMEDVVTKFSIAPDDTIVMLYLTFPTRTWREIQGALMFFRRVGASSMLCRKPVKTHPYLCILPDGIRGRQLIEHDYYRRQDYPEVMEICHFVAIFQAAELQRLNRNLYNDDTVYYTIRDCVDVDTEADLRSICG